MPIFPFFPQYLNGLQLVLGLDRWALARSRGVSYRILFIDDSKPENQAWSDQNLSFVAQEWRDVIPLRQGGFAVQSSPVEGGSTQFTTNLATGRGQLAGLELFATPAPPLIVFGPGQVRVEVEVAGKRYPRGHFICGFAPPPALSDEERRAIASRPQAPKTIQFHIGCKLCGTDADYYCTLKASDPRPQNLPSKAVLLDSAPDSWTCACGKNSADLSYLKQGLHDVFRQNRQVSSAQSALTCTPLYEAGRIQDIIAEYDQLIETATDEEEVQKYLEEHPVFWSFLSPTKILHKPAVLTKKKADFGVVTSQRILYFIEIEKPTTRLINQDGSISSEIQKGANQIRDWHLVVDDHRLALLAELGLKESEVHEIRYLLVGGMARRTAGTGLTKLRRGQLAPDTHFYCFDELESFLHTLAAELGRL